VSGGTQLRIAGAVASAAVANGFNFTRDVLERLARERPRDEALRAVAGDGTVRTFTFEQAAAEAAAAAGGLAAAGVRRGDVVMTLMGARPEWVFALLGAWRLGAVALPGSEQLRAKDISLRLAQARPVLVLASERDMAELEEALRGIEHPPRRHDVDADGLPSGAPAGQPAATSAADPALLIFTSGTAGAPRAVVHGQGYLRGQATQATHWFGSRAGELAWCTAASGWSKSARNAFVAPWTTGAAALLHDARFEPAERLAMAAEHGVGVLCQSPTEYRMIAKRASLPEEPLPSLRRLVSAGEPLNPEVIGVFRDAVGLEIHDGYGQTETGQLTGMPEGVAVRPGSMGKPLPGFGLEVRDADGNPAGEGELTLDPATVPTFFRGYLGEPAYDQSLWRTGDRVRRDEDGFLWFEGRLDDVILSAGYRIGPFEVESALVEHPAVAEAAAVAAPDAERGAVVRAVVVLAPGRSGDAALARELQDHVKRATAPYKYPRIVEFAEELPKTASGKIRRAELRGGRLDAM
jgi:acyl-coenzyme A synthetase/AMP-(fatty) acid ligase